MQTIADLKVGADPEFFVRRGIHYISGHEFECGTKQKPMKTAHGHVQVDGVALEVNVNPANSREAFIYNVRSGIADLRDIVKHKQADVIATPSAFFGNKKLSSYPEEARKLGCTPDFNAYTMKMNPRPDAETPFRTGSGHVHIGWCEDVTAHSRMHMGMCSQIVKQLDYYLGLPSLLWDKDSRRRQLYGKAGAFRPKSYGVEYRVLSNAWIDTDKLIGWVYDRTIAAFKDLANGNDLYEKYGDIARKVIDDNTVDWRKSFPAVAREVLV